MMIFLISEGITEGPFVGGRKLDPLATYSVTVNEGLAALLPAMGLQLSNLKVLPDLEYVVLRDYVMRIGEVETGSQGRIMDVADIKHRR